MQEIQHPTRRKILISSLLLPLAAGTSATRAGAALPDGGKTVVAFFSRSGNTRIIAGLLSRALPADIVEIIPAAPYPADYFATVEQAQEERDTGFEPPLQATLAGIAAYETVYLGFPIWGTTAPPVIRSFLSAHDLSGKALVPFITHGGYGLGTSLDVIRSHAPGARLVEGFAMQAPQERHTIEQVTRWLNVLESPR